MKGFWLKSRLRYEQFMEKQGFYLLLGLCVAVIGATALWTRRQQETPAPPAPPAQAVQAQRDETLAQARGAAPTATPAPLTFQRPVPGKALRGFDGARPVFFDYTGHWQLHTGQDYAADAGEPVAAIAGGTVRKCENGDVVVSHGQGWESRYLGLASTVYVQAGDPVQPGQTLGHAGLGPLWEQGDGYHVHLEVSQNGVALDPESLF